MKCDSPSLIISLIIRQPAKHSYVVSLWNGTVKSDSEAIEGLFTLIGYKPLQTANFASYHGKRLVVDLGASADSSGLVSERDAP
jgi:hypothetical protein